MKRILTVVCAILLIASPVFGSFGVTSDFNEGKAQDFLTREESANRFIPAPSFFQGGRGGQMVKDPSGDTIYVVERNSRDGQSADFAFLDTSDFTWSQGPDLPFQIDDQGAIGITDSGETLAVMFPKDGQSDELALFNTSNQTWSIGAQVPEELVEGSQADGGMNGKMATLGDSMFYCGGFEGTGNANACLKYEADRDTFIRIANLPDSSDLGSMSPVIDKGDTHVFYFHQGENPGNGNTGNIWEYVIEADTFNVVQSMPTPLIGEGGHWNPVPLGSDTQFIPFIQATLTSRAGALGLYNHRQDRWSMIFAEGFIAGDANQLSLIFLGTTVVGNTIKYRGMVSSNALHYDSYQRRSISFIEGE